MDTPEIPGYKILSPLGEGGMAEVYLAIQENFQRKVAVKVLSQRLLSDASFCERFLREARIVAQLSHQHIVPVFDVGQHGDCHYIAMELLRGGDLKQRLEKGLPLAGSMKIVREIASALHYSASKNVVHRDIKPENILFREDGSAVVSDFGIARSTESESNMTLTGTIIGTPSYMSPEQAQALALDGRSDLYSLGIILFEMLTGYVPYTADSAISIGLKHITEPIPELPEDRADFQELIDKAIAKLPEERFQTGQEFINALLDVEHYLQQAGNSTTIINTVANRRNRTDKGRATRVSSSARARSRSGTSRTFAPMQSGAIGGRQQQPQGIMSRKGLLVISIAGIVAVGGVAGWWLFSESGDSQSSNNSLVFSEKTRLLLEKATLSFKENRLYAPPENNAQYYYSTMLTLEPNNVQAIEGIESLVSLYLDKSQDAISAKNNGVAIEWLNRAAQISFFTNSQQLAVRQQKIRLEIFQLQQQRVRLEESERQVQQLLEQGNIALVDNRLTSPVDDNAYDKFQAALTLDPSNVAAMQGLKSIAANYLDQARAQSVSHNFVRARALVAAALQIDSQHSDLKAVHEMIVQAEGALKNRTLGATPQTGLEATLLKQQDEATRQRALEISELLIAANQDLESNRLQLPKGNNAVDKFKTVLALDPSNIQALEGLQEVGEKYIALASGVLNNLKLSNNGGANTHLNDADTYIAVAQKLVPHSQALLSVRRELLNAKERLAGANDMRQQSDRELNQLFAKARADESAGRKSLPIGNNALEKYSQILVIDPNNEAAKTGRKKIINTLMVETEKAIRNNQFDAAMLSINTITRFVSKGPKIDSLLASLKVAQQQFSKKNVQVAALLKKANKLTKKSRSLINNAQLRTVYADLVRIDPENAEAKSGLNKVSDYDIVLAKEAIKSKNYSKAADLVERMIAFTPSYKPAIAMKNQLKGLLSANKKISEYIANAEKEFSRADFLSKSDVARHALKSVYQNIQSAKKLGATSDVIAVIEKKLESSFVEAAEYFTREEEFDRGTALIADASSLGISAQSINEQKRLLVSKKEAVEIRDKKKKLTRQMGVF